LNSDIHHLVTVNDGKSDTAEIIRVFSEIAAGRLKSDLKLLNYVDEVPVSYGSVLNSVSDDSIELAVHEHQAVIMKHHKSTLVKSRHFHNELGVHCYSTYVNIPKKTVILNNFAYAQIRAERREAVRVKIRRELPVRFTCENVNIEGNMIDISGSGISILSSLMPRIDTNQSGYLHFKLSDIPLEVTGSFVRSVEKGDDEHICIFRMITDRQNDSIIGRFIYQRQIEIIQELKDGLVAE